MYVRPHTLFQRFMAGLDAEPESSAVQSAAKSPKLGDFLVELDHDMSLDWSGQSFQGLPALRENIVQRTGTGAFCGVDDVLITAGAAEANFLAISQLVQPGDEMIVDVPGWPQPLVLGEAIGATVTPLPRDEGNDWRFDMDQLAATVSDKTKLIFICNPNNPTGQLMTESELTELVAIAERVGAYVLCDEVYAGLEWDVPAVARVANHYERGISTGSVSKVLGLQGLRTGWLICRDRQVVFDAMVLREDTSEIMNIMGEAIAEIALRDSRYATAVASARADGLANIELVDTWIAERPEVSWVRPAAGLIGFCRLHTPFTADTLADKLLQPPYKTFVMPGSAYNCPQHLRLGFGGGADANLEQALQHLGRCLDELAQLS